jgi:hypothetical protein
MTDGEQTIISVFIGNAAGVDRFEKLWVEGRPDGSFRLVRTPKLALGLAREDVFRVDADRNIVDVESGGYHAFQVIMDEPFTEQSLRELIQLPDAFAGTFDVHDDIVAGLAIPESADWSAFKAAMEGFTRRFHGTYWNASAAPPEVRGAHL